MKTLSIVIPVYNEKKTLEKVLDRVNRVSIGDLKKEIIIVDDYSTDGTRDLLKNLSRSGQYRIFYNEKNKGKGAAVIVGFKEATGDYIIIQDADLEYNPDEYGILLGPLLSGEADVVFGSRFMGDKAHRVLYFWHYLGNRFLTLLSNFFTNLNLTDMETCYKVFTKDALKKILPDLRSMRFGLEPEITALVSYNKLRVYEVGISYFGRTYEDGKKINWKDGVSAVWTIVKSKLRFSSYAKDKYKLKTLILAGILVILSVCFFKPNLNGGDTTTYVQSMSVIKTGLIEEGFMPNRLTSTYLGLKIILLFTMLTDSLLVSWILINSVLFVFLSVIFFKLSKKIFENSKVAFWTTTLLIGNYAAINFGPAALMDVGGWFFYLVAVYYSYKYFQSKKIDNIWIASVVVSVGGLWKEYTFLAVIVMALSVLYHEWKNPKHLFKTGVIVGVVSFLPFILLNYYIYQKFNYTYVDWFKYQTVYVYKSRILEYIKAFGSLYSIGWFVFLAGLYIFLKKLLSTYKTKEINKFSLDYIFILFILISATPFPIWLAITQRILFITMPGVVLVSGLFFKKYEKYNISVTMFLLGYLLISFFMNSYILGHVNL